MRSLMKLFTDSVRSFDGQTPSTELTTGKEIETTVQVTNRRRQEVSSRVVYNQRPSIDTSLRERFEAYAPTYWVGATSHKARLRSVELSKRNYETIAYYDVIVPTKNRTFTVYTFIYAERYGALECIHAHPPVTH